MSAAPLIIAVPSKGRLQENATAFFARAGLEFAKAAGSRGYRGIIKGMPEVEIAFLSASEIVTHLVQGSAHFGVTGEDLIREQAADADAAITLVTPLGFGHANVIVAAPQAWIDVACMADLDDVAVDLRTRKGRKMRVATKYVNLTRAFFARHGIADYRIVESLGATEGTPASGAAEIIVDITTTGATLAANALKVLDDGVILRSQANLAASLQADWSPEARAAARAILTRIAAEEEARRVREVRAQVMREHYERVAAVANGFDAHLLSMPDASELVLHCAVDHVFDIASELAAAGARDISVRSLDYVFRAHNPLIARLEKRLPQ
jgi:ATP phosphoribosyltransferase